MGSRPIVPFLRSGHIEEVRSDRDDMARLLRTHEPPLDRAALLVARDARPELDIEAYLARLDAMAEPVAQALRSAPSPAAQAEILAARLGRDLGLAGNTEVYYDARNSYLDQVIDRRLGIPISLAAVWIAVGRRAGVTVDGVGFPGHFLARVGGPEGVYVDAFAGGRVLAKADLAALARQFLGTSGSVRPDHLAPVPTRAIIVRMLLNLKLIHEQRRDHASALVACDRLVDLVGSAEQRRDRGLHALALGAVEAADADLRAYLAARAGAPDVAAIEATLARAMRAPRVAN